MSKRSMICGVGINDADYPVNPRINGTEERIECPFYNRWRYMLTRCYSYWGLTKPPFCCTISDGLVKNMSLLSQQDRQMAIEALEYYVQKLKDDNCNQAAITSFQTLLNWIELEHYKHEN